MCIRSVFAHTLTKGSTQFVQYTDSYVPMCRMQVFGAPTVALEHWVGSYRISRRLGERTNSGTNCGKFFFFVRKETSILLVAALVVLPESTHNEANRQPTTENGLQPWPATACGRKCPGRTFPHRGPKKKPQGCAARRNRTAGSTRRPAGEVQAARPTVSERARRRHATDARRFGRPHRRPNGNCTGCAGTSATAHVAAPISAAATANTDDATGASVPAGNVLARELGKSFQPGLRLREQRVLAPGPPQCHCMA